MSQELEHARARAVYTVHSGSYMYGLTHKDSDEDMLGVFVDTPQNILGFPAFQNIRGTEFDESYKHLRDYAKHLSNGSHYWIETLFAPVECITVRHPAFDCFLKNRNVFLTKAFIYKSLRFMRAMVTQSLNESNLNAPKQLSHAVRVGYMLSSWMDTGVFDVRTPEHNDELMGIKLGNISSESAKEKSMSLHEYINGKFLTCVLPEQVNAEFLNSMITDTTLAYWSSRGEL